MSLLFVYHTPPPFPGTDTFYVTWGAAHEAGSVIAPGQPLPPHGRPLGRLNSADLKEVIYKVGGGTWGVSATGSVKALPLMSKTPLSPPAGCGPVQQGQSRAGATPLPRGPGAHVPRGPCSQPAWGVAAVGGPLRGGPSYRRRRRQPHARRHPPDAQDPPGIRPQAVQGRPEKRKGGLHAPSSALPSLAQAPRDGVPVCDCAPCRRCSRPAWRAGRWLCS